MRRMRRSSAAETLPRVCLARATNSTSYAGYRCQEYMRWVMLLITVYGITPCVQHVLLLLLLPRLWAHSLTYIRSKSTFGAQLKKRTCNRSKIISNWVRAIQDFLIYLIFLYWENGYTLSRLSPSMPDCNYWNKEIESKLSLSSLISLPEGIQYQTSHRSEKNLAHEKASVLWDFCASNTHNCA